MPAPYLNPPHLDPTAGFERIRILLLGNEFQLQQVDPCVFRASPQPRETALLTERDTPNLTPPVGLCGLNRLRGALLGLVQLTTHPRQPVLSHPTLTPALVGVRTIHPLHGLLAVL